MFLSNGPGMFTEIITTMCVEEGLCGGYPGRDIDGMDRMKNADPPVVDQSVVQLVVELSILTLHCVIWRVPHASRAQVPMVYTSQYLPQ